VGRAGILLLSAGSCRKSPNSGDLTTSPGVPLTGRRRDQRAFDRCLSTTGMRGAQI
jgi:hypothetical protein